MDCQRAIELLPWYLNGTLEADERSQLEEHLTRCDGCQAELREAETAQVLFGGHPPTGLLVDYAFERSGPATEILEAHLSGCESCAEELAMLRDSRAELARGRPPERRAEIVPFRQPAEISPLWRAAAVAAAVVGLIGIGGGMWSWRALDRQQGTFAERHRTAELRIAELEEQLRGAGGGTRVNVPIYDLWPEGDTLRSPGSEPMRLPATPGPPATLILNSQPETVRRVDRMELRDAQDEVLQSLSGINSGPNGSLTLSLPLDRLQPGRYRLQLFAGAAPEPLESYLFELY